MRAYWQQVAPLTAQWWIDVYDAPLAPVGFAYPTGVDVINLWPELKFVLFCLGNYRTDHIQNPSHKTHNKNIDITPIKSTIVSQFMELNKTKIDQLQAEFFIFSQLLKSALRLF